MVTGKYSINVEDNQITIYIGGIIHIMLRKDKFLGFQAWRIGSAYRVEFYLVGATVPICTEYESKEKWTKVLALLDRRDLCIGGDE